MPKHFEDGVANTLPNSSSGSSFPWQSELYKEHLLEEANLAGGLAGGRERDDGLPQKRSTDQNAPCCALGCISHVVVKVVDPTHEVNARVRCGVKVQCELQS